MNALAMISLGSVTLMLEVKPFVIVAAGPIWTKPGLAASTAVRLPTIAAPIAPVSKRVLIVGFRPLYRDAPVASSGTIAVAVITCPAALTMSVEDAPTMSSAAGPTWTKPTEPGSAIVTLTIQRPLGTTARCRSRRPARWSST